MGNYSVVICVQPKNRKTRRKNNQLKNESRLLASSDSQARVPSSAVPLRKKAEVLLFGSTECLWTDHSRILTWTGDELGVSGRHNHQN